MYILLMLISLMSYGDDSNYVPLYNSLELRMTFESIVKDKEKKCTSDSEQKELEKWIHLVKKKCKSIKKAKKPKNTFDSNDPYFNSFFSAQTNETNSYFYNCLDQTINFCKNKEVFLAKKKLELPPEILNQSIDTQIKNICSIHFHPTLYMMIRSYTKISEICNSRENNQTKLSLIKNFLNLETIQKDFLSNLQLLMNIYEKSACKNSTAFCNGLSILNSGKKNKNSFTENFIKLRSDLLKIHNKNIQKFAKDKEAAKDIQFTFGPNIGPKASAYASFSSYGENFTYSYKDSYTNDLRNQSDATNYYYILIANYHEIGHEIFHYLEKDYLKSKQENYKKYFQCLFDTALTDRFKIQNNQVTDIDFEEMNSDFYSGFALNFLKNDEKNYFQKGACDLYSDKLRNGAKGYLPNIIRLMIALDAWPKEDPNDPYTPKPCHKILLDSQSSDTTHKSASRREAK